MVNPKFTYQNENEFSISQCAYCKHKGNGRFCTAFKEIPMDILLNEFDHRNAHEGDNDIQFEPNEGLDKSVIDRLFK